MCMSLAFLEQILIWLIVVLAVVAIIRVFVGLTGTVPGWVLQIINIVLGAVIAIIVVMVVFDLLSCLLFSAPRIR